MPTTRRLHRFVLLAVCAAGCSSTAASSDTRSTADNGAVVDRGVQVDAPAPLAMTTDALAPGILQAPYVAKLLARGGQGPYRWTLTEGAFPDGVALTSAGVLAGKPTAAGSYTFTVQVTDALGAQVTRVFSVEVRPWQAFLRTGHPRLFFNAESWPAVRERATGVMRDFYVNKVKPSALTKPPEYDSGVDAPFVKPDPRAGTTTEVRDWGKQLMAAALVYRVEPSEEQLKRIKEMLYASLDYYNASTAAGNAVSWYSITRVSWLAALDWVWDRLTAAERKTLGQGMLTHVCRILSTTSTPLCGTLPKPAMKNAQNVAGYDAGYYGDDNLAWFTGLLFYQEGINDAAAETLLKRGYDEHQQLFAYRAGLSGESGGAASATVTYSFQHYSWAEWNFFHTWQSATGHDVALFWPYLTRLPHYVLWNWLPGGEQGFEYGFGDTPHIDNTFPGSYLYTHLSHLMHFYAKAYPEEMSLAAHARERAGGAFRAQEYPIYPFLLTELEHAPAPAAPTVLPPAQHFDGMGQIFMRSGAGPDDTYALFAIGGRTVQHRHYDQTHFTIYHKGFLALDTGSRHNKTPSLQNYYGQTVAHNAVLINMPGEAVSPYWNGTVEVQDGGQYDREHSTLLSFKSTESYTYVAANATRAYRSTKCKQMVRQFLFLPPSHFIIFDRVEATQASYAKRWLLHHANEPLFSGHTWRSDQGQGRLWCRTLLPEDAKPTKIGGPGQEFVADGKNYPVYTSSSAVPEMMGRWRVEITPRTARTDDVFLHLIEVGEQTLTLSALAPATVSTTADAATLQLTAGGREITARFNKTGAVGAHLTMRQSGKAIVDEQL